jgi:hypothetical protein
MRKSLVGALSFLGATGCLCAFAAHSSATNVKVWLQNSATMFGQPFQPFYDCSDPTFPHPIEAWAAGRYDCFWGQCVDCIVEDSVGTTQTTSCGGAQTYYIYELEGSTNNFCGNVFSGSANCSLTINATQSPGSNPNCTPVTFSAAAVEQ